MIKIYIIYWMANLLNNYNFHIFIYLYIYIFLVLRLIIIINIINIIIIIIIIFFFFYLIKFLFHIHIQLIAFIMLWSKVLLLTIPQFTIRHYMKNIIAYIIIINYI